MKATYTVIARIALQMLIVVGLAFLISYFLF